MLYTLVTTKVFSQIQIGKLQTPQDTTTEAIIAMILPHNHILAADMDR